MGSETEQNPYKMIESGSLKVLAQWLNAGADKHQIKLPEINNGKATIISKEDLLHYAINLYANDVACDYNKELARYQKDQQDFEVAQMCGDSQGYLPGHNFYRGPSDPLCIHYFFSEIREQKVPESIKLLLAADAQIDEKAIGSSRFSDREYGGHDTSLTNYLSRIKSKNVNRPAPEEFGLTSGNINEVKNPVVTDAELQNPREKGWKKG